LNEKKLPGESISPDMKTGLNTPNRRGRFYEIHVQGHLSEIWADWFEELTIDPLDNGKTILSGCIIDQAALMGILNKIHRLNLTLLGVREIDSKEFISHEPNECDQ
jgi:hypothetical protein